MSILWLLSEECPKKEVILEILNYYTKDKKKLLQKQTPIEIIPVMNSNQFLFEYDLFLLKILDNLVFPIIKVLHHEK